MDRKVLQLASDLDCIVEAFGSTFSLGNVVNGDFAVDDFGDTIGDIGVGAF